MQGPDDNSPTIPERTPARAPLPGDKPHDWLGNDDAQPLAAPINAPPASNDGKPPVWDVPAAPRPQGGGTNLQGFSIGFAIALFVLAAMAVVLIIVFIVNGNKTNVAQTTQLTPGATVTITPKPLTPTATALPPLDATTASNIVANFYTAISAKSYQQAYTLRSKAYQSSHTLSQFTSDWKNTDTISFDQTSITTNPGDSNTVNVVLTYNQSLIVSGGTETNKTYQATLNVGYDGGLVHILAVNAQAITPTATPVAPTVPVPTEGPPPTGTTTPVTPTTTTATKTPTP